MYKNELKREPNRARLALVTKEMDEPRMAGSARKELEPDTGRTPASTPTNQMHATSITPEQYRLLQKTQQYYVNAINDYATWKVREGDKRTKTQLQRRLNEVEKQLCPEVPPDPEDGFRDAPPPASPYAREN